MRIWPRILIGATLCLLLALGATAASAGTTYTVTKTDDTADGTCNSDCSLREAISAANAAGGGRIMLGAGNYAIGIPGAGEQDNATGSFDIKSDITIEGLGQDKTAVDGGHLDTVFDIVFGGKLTLESLTVKDGEGTTAGNILTQGALSLDGVTVSGGTATASGGTGGIVGFAPITIVNSTITDNHATNQGAAGGIFGKAPLSLLDTVVSDNSASPANDGAAGGIVALTDVTLTNVDISGNSVAGNDVAAGLITSVSSHATLTNVAITGNDGQDSDCAGGIYNQGTMTVTQLNVGGNHGDNGGPGGIWNEGTFTATDLVVDNNDVHSGGSGATGGVYASLGSFTVNRGSISGNTGGGSSDEAGGIWLASSTGDLTNVTIDGNTTTGSGYGGLHAGTSALHPHVDLTNVTISSNTGGGLDNDGTVALKNSILAGNGASNCSGSPLTTSGVNIDSGTTCGFQSPNLSSTDPLLGELQDNGGYSRTEALHPGSPAIDAATGCPPPDTDARGVGRPIGDACDIGAFEAEAGVLWGDMNCDGAIDGLDALAMLHTEASLSNPTLPAGCPQPGDQVWYNGDDEETWGDLNCTADVNESDALFPLRYVLGLPTGTGSCPPVGATISTTAPAAP